MDLREVEGDGEEGKGNPLLIHRDTNFFSPAFSLTLYFLVYAQLLHRRTHGV